MKNNKFYLELDNDKETYKWPAKEKVESKQVKTSQAKIEKVNPEDTDNKKNIESSDVGTTDEVQPTPQPIDTSYSEEPAWIKGLYEQKEEISETAIIEKTFAANAIVAKPRPNRRPGGSINKFRDLARELK